MEYNPLVLKLGTDDCAEVYANILHSDETNLHDNVMLAVMRMFMNEKRLTAMKESKGRIQLQTKYSTFYMEGDGAFNKEVFVHDGSPFNQFRYGVMVNIVTNANSKELLAESEKYNKDYEEDGWKKLEDVSLYIDKDGEVLVYQNEAKKGTLIFTGGKKALQAIHMAASCFPRLTPWCFKDAPITEDEKTIVRYLYDGKEAEFCDAMQKLFDEGDYYGKKIAASLKGFCSANFNGEIRRQTQDIEQREKAIREQFDNINRLQRQLEDARIKLAALHNKTYCTDEDEAEIVNFLKVNKALKFLKKDGDRMYVGFNGFLSDYDEGQFKHSVENQKNSKNYIYGKSPYPFEETKAFFMAIWKEHRFNIRTYCEWYVSSDDRVYPVTRSNMERHPEMMDDRIRQPHIDRHACFSGYEYAFENLAKDHDFIGTLSTIISSSSSLNWGDSTVVGELMDDLFFNCADKKVLEDNNGNLYTVAEVFEILKNEREAA